MPWRTVKLVPGVRTEPTPTLLEAGITASNLIRYREGLPEKLGGWSLFYGNPMASTPRALWAWGDLNAVNHLAIGQDSGLSVLTNGMLQDISPQYNVSNNAPMFSTVSGSAIVTITDAGSNVTTYDSVFIATPVSVGGLIIYGLYPITGAAPPNAYTITASALATGTVTNGGAVPVYTTSIGSAAVNVLLDNHGYAVGSTYAAPIATSVGGITIQGFYTVNVVVDANNFTIDAANLAVSSATVAENGGNAQIYYWITPTQSLPGTGYGVGGYGMGGYGTGIAPPPFTGGTIVTPQDWSLANFGSALISNPQGYGIFIWSPNSGLRGSQIISADPNTPYAATGIFVAMPQQQIVAYGASVLGVQDPMLVAWCDNANYNVWAASSANQAGTYRLTRGSKIIGGIQGPQQAMLWTDVGLWLMIYIGYPLVYGFWEIAQGCGLIGRGAVGVIDTTVYWMSANGFWAYAGTGAQRVQCTVWDEVFQDINQAYAYKIKCVANTEFDEITWYFVSLSNGGAENSKYVKFNVVLGTWDYGDLAVSAGIDANIFGPPLLSYYGDDLGASAYELVQLETSDDAVDSPIDWWFETGLFVLTEGEDFLFVDYMVPDFKYEKVGATQSANIAITLYAQDFPWATPAALGPYTVNSGTTAVSTRVRGRYFSLRVEGDDLGTWARLGGIKMRFAPDGRN